MRIVLVGSGTGGHFYPLIAVAESLRMFENTSNRPTELYFIGPDPYDPSALTKNNITFVYCPAGKQRLYRSFKNVTDVLKTSFGFFVAFWRLLLLYPDAVFSKGGYTSVPVVLAAWLLRIPIVVHESDAVVGRANAIAAKFAQTVTVAHTDAVTEFTKKEAIVVGMPIRKSFFTPTVDPFATLGIPSDRPVLFVTGGSTGAQRINDLLLNSLDELLPYYTIVHQTGKANVANVSESASALIADETLRGRYFAHGYLTPEQMAAAQDAAALIISRAGSGTIFEIALKGKPSILIPIPEDVSRDQRSNAYAYARSGAASVL